MVLHTEPTIDICPNEDNLKIKEDEKVHQFLINSCNCNLASGSCSKLFTVEYVTSVRAQCSELSRAELDLVLLGQLSAFMNTSEQTVHSMTHRHSHSTRERSYLQFWHGGNRVCKKCSHLCTPSLKRGCEICGRAYQQMASPLVVMETQSACHQIQSVLKLRKEPSTFSLHTLRPMLFCCQAGSQATNVLTCSSYHRVPLSTKCGFNTAHPSRVYPPHINKLHIPPFAPFGDAYSPRYHN